MAIHLTPRYVWLDDPDNGRRVLVDTEQSRPCRGCGCWYTFDDFFQLDRDFCSDACSDAFWSSRPRLRIGQPHLNVLDVAPL